MKPTLQNQSFQFVIDTEKSVWSLYDPSKRSIRLENIRMQLVYRIGKRTVSELTDWRSFNLSTKNEITFSRTNSQHIILESTSNPHGLLIRVIFTLHPQLPLFLWQVNIQNHGESPLDIYRIEMMQIGKTGNSETPSAIYNLGTALAFYSNGWGSWNYTAAYGAEDKYRRTRLGFIHAPMQVNAGTPQPNSRGVFSSDMFGILGSRNTRKALLAGFLSQQQHFGSLEVNLKGDAPSLKLWANGDHARLDPGKSIATDWGCIQFLDIDADNPISAYLQAVAEENGVSKQITQAAIPTGWCSWYMFYQDISASKIIDNTRALKQIASDLPLKIIQIDDGFQTAVGDWLSIKDTFPDGVAPLAKEIYQSGFTPGLWLAPYIVDPRSRLAKEHPDWLLRGKFNRPVNAGFTSWGVFATALDLTNQEASDYIREVIHTAVAKWGYPYLKLDFLYAAALPGHYADKTKTRAQVLREGLLHIREAAGADTYLLGCGCPLGSAIGIVDAMRIGTDVDERWNPSYNGITFFFDKEPDFPSVRNAVHNIFTRAFLHRSWWINDPDTLLLRDTTQLTLAEVQSLATAIALSGGSVLLSDDIPNLTAERLKIARVLLPPAGKKPAIPDWFDTQNPQQMRLDLQNETGSWILLGFFNWNDHTEQLQLNNSSLGLNLDAEYILREFWTGSILRLTASETPTVEIPPHGTALFGIRAVKQNVPLYVGSDLHFSQGMEVHSWEASLTVVKLAINRPGNADGNLYLRLPSPPVSVLLNRESVVWKRIGEDIYRLPVQFTQRGEITIQLSKR